MTNIEYRKFKAHIYMHFDPKELKDEIEHYKTLPKTYGLTWNAVYTMCQYGRFDIYYDEVMETLKEVYGDKFDKSKYLTKDGSYRFKNNEAYCWSVYKAKLAKTIEIMEKKGEL